MNTFITELQNSYLILNTSLLKLQNNISNSVDATQTQVTNNSLLGQNLTKVTIEEEEEEEEDPDDPDNMDENEVDDPELEQQPEPNSEDENVLMDIMEKRD